MARGRKRKAVKREPNGRASRKGLPRVIFDQGTDRAKEKVAAYGTEGADAIGRAYVAGLLGENADAIRDTARNIFCAYWPTLEVGSFRCTLNDARGASNDNFDPERIKARERWLNSVTAQVDKMGRATRKAFDELVIDPQPDHGPKWLDSLIWHKQHGKPIPARDSEMLFLAMSAMNRIIS